MKGRTMYNQYDMASQMRYSLTEHLSRIDVKLIGNDPSQS